MTIIEPRAHGFLPLIGLAISLIYLETVVQNTKHCASITKAKGYCLSEKMNLSYQGPTYFAALGPEARNSETKKFEDLYARLESVRNSKINQYVQCGARDGDMNELRECSLELAREIRKFLSIDVTRLSGDARAAWPGQNVR